MTDTRRKPTQEDLRVMQAFEDMLTEWKEEQESCDS